MTTDSDGNVYLTLGRAVSIFSKDGKKVATISVPENATNVCFGGKDRQTLFITAGTSLYAIAMKVKGPVRQ
jgi:gluconolactonase